MLRSSIARQIAAGTLTVALAVSAVFGVAAYRKAEEAVTAAAVGELVAVAAARERAIVDHLEALTDQVRLIGGQRALLERLRIFDSGGGPEAAREGLQGILAASLDALRGVQALAVIGRDGRALASTDPAAFGDRVDNWPAFATGLEALHMHGVVRSRRGEPVLLVTMPLMQSGAPLGSLWALIRPGELHDITRDYDSLGRSGETLVARRNDDGGAQYLTPLRFDPDAALKRAVGPEQAHSPVIRALARHEGVMLDGAVDYRGRPVIAATRYIPQLDWGLVAKMNRDEVFAGVGELRDWMLATGLICVLAATGISAGFATSLTRPIQALSETAAQVERGDTGLRAPVTSSDEIGDLAGAFNRMLDSQSSTQQSLRKQEAMNRAVIETAVDGIVTIDERGTILSVNAACEALFGYSHKELAGRNVSMLMPAAYAAEHDGYMLAYFGGGESRFLGSGRRVLGRRSNGEVFPIEVSVGQAGGAQADGTEGRIFVGTIRDITERKRAEDDLARRAETIALLRRTTAAANEAETLEQALATALSEICRFTGCAVGHAWLVAGPDSGRLLPSGIWHVDDDVAFEAFRRATGGLVLGPGEDLPGRVLEGEGPLIVDSLTDWRRLPRLRHAVEAGLHGAYAFRIASAERVVGVAEFFCRGDAAIDRERLDLLSTIGAQLARVAERAEAARELRTHAEELARSNDDLEQFAYVASHDLKAPLRGIDNAIGWLAEDLDAHLSGETRRTFELMRARIRRLEKLLDDLLRYSRAGRSDQEVLFTDVGALLADVIDLLAPPEGLEIGVEGSMPTLWTARSQLEVVFRNLIGNAIKHNVGSGTEAGIRPRIAVSVAEDGEAYRFTVADNGPGIAPKYREQVFRMFQTLRRRDEVEGSGMGLAIVKKLVERQGGRIRVEDGLANGRDGARAEHLPGAGHGAAFTFTWRKEQRHGREADPGEPVRRDLASRGG